ncbi:hypothetical protein EZS27_003789 [termite gut metagenome]|uniref:BACON domain-containing protein n=1 Tax=termite gut metagenome TaxID=433724 RepID=A0A5J4STQ4_9ZZZZ
MKKQVALGKRVGWILPFLFFGTACSSDSGELDGEQPELPFLTIIDTTVTLAADDQESKTITVKTNITGWTVSADNDWCTAGGKDGKIVISASPNEGATARSATVSVNTGNDQAPDVTIHVTQRGATPTLQVDKSAASFDSEGGQDKITVITNIPEEEWTFEYEASAEWCLVETEGKVLTITVEANPGPARTTEIKITSGLMPESLTITVTQSKNTTIVGVGFARPTTGAGFSITRYENKTKSIQVSSRKGIWMG